jgi:hypothetical protein
MHRFPLNQSRVGQLGQMYHLSDPSTLLALKSCAARRATFGELARYLARQEKQKNLAQK